MNIEDIMTTAELWRGYLASIQPSSANHIYFPADCSEALYTELNEELLSTPMLRIYGDPEYAQREHTTDKFAGIPIECVEVHDFFTRLQGKLEANPTLIGVRWFTDRVEHIYRSYTWLPLAGVAIGAGTSKGKGLYLYGSPWDSNRLATFTASEEFSPTGIYVHLLSGLNSFQVPLDTDRGIKKCLYCEDPNHAYLMAFPSNRATVESHHHVFYRGEEKKQYYFRTQEDFKDRMVIVD